MGSAPVAAFRPPGPPWDVLVLALVLAFALIGVAGIVATVLAAAL